MAILIGGTTIIDNSRNLTNVASIFSCTGIASQAEAQAGTSNTVLMTPLRVAQAISALGGQVINRIQRGSTSWLVLGSPTPSFVTPVSYSVPITSVDTSKSFISQSQRNDHKYAGGGLGYTDATSSSVCTASARLTSSTGITVTTGAGNGQPAAQSISGIVDWEVIEFK